MGREVTHLRGTGKAGSKLAIFSSPSDGESVLASVSLPRGESVDYFIGLGTRDAFGIRVRTWKNLRQHHAIKSCLNCLYFGRVVQQENTAPAMRKREGGTLRVHHKRASSSGRTGRCQCSNAGSNPVARST